MSMSVRSLYGGLTFLNPLLEPTNIASKTLTHILYAFADTDPIYGNVTLTDLFADQQKHCELHF